MTGRPTTYSEAKAKEICHRVAGGETLTSISKDLGMPDRGTVWQWTLQNPSFADAYGRARLAYADSIADEIVEISDTDEDYQRAKNRIDARKWAAKVTNPQRYGDRLDLNVTERPNLADIRSRSLENLPPDVADRLTGSASGLIESGTESDILDSKRDDSLADLLE